MVKRGLAFGGILAILSGVGIYNNIYAAETGSTKFSVDVNNAVLELTIPSSPAVIDLNPTMTNASFGSTSINVHVATNNITGYTLTMTPTNNQEATSLIRTELIGDEEDYREIETLEQTDPISTGYTEQTFTTNAWGYKITGDNYYGIDPENTTISHPAWVTSEPTNSTNHNLTLAAKVDSDTVSGAYETTLNFHAVTNTVPLVSLEMSYDFHGKQKVAVGNEEYYKMQDMDSRICNATTEIPSELQLVDIRDEKIYWIAKLADGHCWMTQNLDLDLETTPTHVLALTSENTDLNEYGSNGYDSNNGYSKDADNVITWVPERSTIPSSSISSIGNIPGFNLDKNNPYSVDAGDWYWTDTWYNNACDSGRWCDYLSGNENGKFSTSPYAGNGKHGHVGNYYNWTAAIASNNSASYVSNGNSQNSICPVGWRLPTAANYGPTDEFTILLVQYDAYVVSGSERDESLTSRPLWFVRGGSCAYNKLRSSGHAGFYYSSSVFGREGSYMMEFSSSTLNPHRTFSYRDYGQSVRCIAR